MAESFEDLGLRTELVEAVRARGWPAPSSLQRAAMPVIRRGGNAVLRGSAGAGVLGAYGLGLLDRVADADAASGLPLALVLAPTPQVAAGVAASLAPLADAVGLRVHASGPGWPGQAGDAAVFVATPRAVLEALSASRLKLDGVQTLVLDDAGAFFQLGDGQALEALTDALPREAQRVVVGDPEGAVADFVERHARRALTFPPVPADAEAAAPVRDGGRVAYVVATGEKLDALVGLLERTPVDVVCRTAARAERVAHDLALRGLGRNARITGPTDASAAGPVISYDVPFDAEELRGRHAAGGAVVVRPRELSHLRRIAGAGGVSLEAVATPMPAPFAPDVEAFRNRLLEAVRSGDLAAQLLVLEPLLAEASITELAAAACLLARRREVVAPEPAPGRQRPAPGAATAPPPGEPFVRLFVSVGRRDDVGPGDVLGAITGEAGIDGSQVGRIDIGDTFTTVEVESAVARRVIDALNGTTLRSRSLRVDYDRKGPRGAKVGRRPAPRSGPRGRS